MFSQSVNEVIMNDLNIDSVFSNKLINIIMNKKT